jgi:hypothetical protein
LLLRNDVTCTGIRTAEARGKKRASCFAQVGSSATCVKVPDSREPFTCPLESKTLPQRSLC